MPLTPINYHTIPYHTTHKHTRTQMIMYEFTEIEIIDINLPWVLEKSKGGGGVRIDNVSQAWFSFLKPCLKLLLLWSFKTIDGSYRIINASHYQNIQQRNKLRLHFLQSSQYTIKKHTLLRASATLVFILAVSAKSTYTEALRLKTLKRSSALAVRFTLWMYDPDKRCNSWNR